LFVLKTVGKKRACAPHAQIAGERKVKKNGSWLGKTGFALLLALCWPALAAENLNAPLPVNPHLRTGKLDNGLTYYIQQNSRPAKRVELRLVVKAGSILEDVDQQGLAHFTEHMAFDGTRHFEKHELISYLQSLGVKFGADLNAYTSFNETVYILPIPTDKPDNLKTGFQVLQDWAQGVTMDGAAIDKERNVVLEEARLGKGAGDRMMRKLLPEIYNGSRYAERLPIGTEGPGAPPPGEKRPGRGPCTTREQPPPVGPGRNGHPAATLDPPGHPDPDRAAPHPRPSREGP